MVIISERYLRTKKISRVSAIAEPSGGLVPRVVDAIVRVVGLERGQLQVIVVAHIHQRVSKHIHRRNSRETACFEDRQEEEEEEERELNTKA